MISNQALSKAISNRVKTTWPYRVEVNSSAPDITVWCTQHCADEWHHSFGGIFHFKSERDALMFALRWSSN